MEMKFFQDHAITVKVVLLSRNVRKMTALKNVNYSFLFMSAEGSQLTELAGLIEKGIIRPVIDKVFSFTQIPEAISYVESGRAVGKVVVDIKSNARS